MTERSGGPPRRGADGPEVVCSAANASSIAPNSVQAQAKKTRVRLQLVPPAPPPRVEVRIIAYERHVPRARSFRLTTRDYERLVEAAERLAGR